ncbi:MOB kinase activator 2-like isoform X1 [Sinocyclocheilus rhinocerous]|uniref:MOB kinase activator 2-like isoform X1 n=1 Tax=Sinocyclocheilus rhinocerous TaxID=307959 RepID=UPI0007BA9CD7|nr:PREDICTED: MOB kinase activator 2-like isoform X1 [Sinocyclocheilus rhinocerous]
MLVSDRYIGKAVVHVARNYLRGSQMAEAEEDPPVENPHGLLWTLFTRKGKGKPNGKKPPPEEKKHYLDAEHTKVRVVDFDLKELVVLPREIDLNEWLACSTTTFFNLINLQYSTISEFCTGDTCPAMTACNT